MKQERNYLFALIFIVGALAIAGNFWQRHSSAIEAQRIADIQAAKDRAEVAEAAADAAQKEADRLRSELEAKAVKLAAKRQRITEHREAPIDKDTDIRDLRDSFILLGYGLPR